MMTAQLKEALGMVRRNIQPLKALSFNIFGDVARRQGHFTQAVFIAISHTETELTIAPSAWIRSMLGRSLISPISQS